jgi:hypothetical protein
MGYWNLGSVSAYVYDLIPNIPSSISGTRLLEIADQRREFVQDRIGTTIGSNSIDIKYQGIIGNLTAAKVAGFMAIQGLNSSDVRIGDFSVSKSNTVMADLAKNLEANAMQDLESFGVNMPFYKALG